MYPLISIIGILVFMAIAWLLSTHRKIINWRVILWGLLIQIVFALFIFKVPAGHHVFIFLNNVVIKILDSASAGARFVFGRLALPPGTVNEEGEKSLGFILAFQGFPTIIFFSALMAILYFIRVLPFLIRWFAWLFTRLMRISGVESLCTVSNIFFGVESVFTVKPYLKKLTVSEFATILTVSMSTVASNVMALYVYNLKTVFPTIAGHLISASFLSAPAAIIISKLMIPETGEPVTMGLNVAPQYEREENLFSAIINAAQSAVKFIVGIVALLIAIISIVYLVDLILGWLSTLAGFEHALSLKGILGLLFYPFTFLLGIPVQEVGVASQIIGERVVVTEVTAYRDLAVAIQQGVIRMPRTVIITSYALCGFAHFASMAIFVGGLTALVPEKLNMLSRISFKCLIAATLACMMTAGIAGIFMGSGSILF